MPMLLYLVGPKQPSGHCYISCFLTDKTALTVLAFKQQIFSQDEPSVLALALYLNNYVFFN